jgi:DNA-directed RNA polymerase specialized sigma24 family protein
VDDTSCVAHEFGVTQSRADQQDRHASADDREVTAERELLPQVALGQENEHGDGVLAELVSAVWRVLRGMGIADADVTQATRVSFEHAFAELASGAHAAPSTADGLALEHGVIDPLLVAAYRAACTAWRPLSDAHGTEEDREISASSVRFQGELLVLGLLETLDEVKRSCLLLADMELLSSPEIAALTGLRLDVVYDELRKARKAFERARKRYDQAGATIDAETDVRELLAVARARFTPAPASLHGLCAELSERFEATRGSAGVG